MRFYLDEDLSPIIATIAQERFGLDVLSSHELGMNGATDEEQLAFAAALDRVLVTNNRDHFLILAQKFSLEERLFSGILISTNLPVQDFTLVARALRVHHELYPEDVVSWLVDYLRHPSAG